MQLFVVKCSLFRAGALPRLLLWLLCVLCVPAGGRCRADLLFGAVSGGSAAPLTFFQNPDSGFRVSPEGTTPFFECVFEPLWLNPLYVEQAMMPSAAALGLPTDTTLFLAVDSNTQSRLWHIASFDPTSGTYDPTAAKIEFATTGTTVSAAADLSGFPLESGTTGGGQLLAQRFAAGDVISDAVFTSASTQAILLYYEISGSVVSNVEGEFDQDGYVGFRVEKSDLSGYYYGWLSIRDVETAVGLSAAGSGFTLFQIAARFDSTGSDPGIVVGQTLSPGQFTAVPEPSSLAILGVVAASLSVRAYRRRNPAA